MTADLSAASGAASGAASSTPWQRATPTGLATGTSTGTMQSSSFMGPAPLSFTLTKLATGARVPDPLDTGVPAITFPFNPERITMSHTRKSEQTLGSSSEEQVNDLGYVEMSIDNLILAGEETKLHCDTLVAWNRAVPDIPIVIGHGAPTRPILLQLTWGSALSYEVALRSVSITYRWFNATGMPVRAEVGLKLYSDLEKVLPPTNPTSGGPAGRRTRVLDSSDCLPSLAAANYGRPGAWRRIARANGIDDPLRVRPGTQVYLPEPGASERSARRPEQAGRTS